MFVMATWNSSSSSLTASPFHLVRTEAPPRRPSSESPPRMKKMKSMAEIMAKSLLLFEKEQKEDSYSDVTCEKCGSGEKDDELLLCDKCDKGFHMKCLRPIVVRVPIGQWFCVNCSDQRPVRSLSQTNLLHFFRVDKQIDATEKSELLKARKPRRRCLTMKKRRRRLLPFVPSKDLDQRLIQMGTLATALTALGLEYSNELTYDLPGMAPRSANQAEFEKGGIQVLKKEDLETLERCRAMFKRGECPPLVVVFDSIEGYTIEADGPIKDFTLLGEYAGDVDYLKNRENDDCDSIMTLLLTEDPSKSLVVCPDKYSNITRFFSGINNHNAFSKKKQNCKCMRYDVKGECRVLIVATRDISKGERLYFDYNGYEYEYPTHHFI